MTAPQAWTVLDRHDAILRVADSLASRTRMDVEQAATLLRAQSGIDATVSADALREAADDIPDAWAAGWLRERAAAVQEADRP
ncbi:hypothetical protein [Nocardioides nanhaiensis]|uniref:ANTAR domain-containing protein n=1 Tax=Nocardioides nanhaiensis TaxID=1476871 RepID=A0ABP8W4L7_9ACTN